MLIGTRKIGHGEPPFIVAEAAFNHNGNLQRAIDMIEAAAGAKCDAVKFQTYRTREFCQPDDPLYEDFKRGELPDEAWPILKAECDRQSITFLSTPQNPSDLDLLLKVGIPAIKIGSDDLSNIPMLQYCSKDDIGLPLILSCGMANMWDITVALAAVKKCDRAILVCSSQYPCPEQECNIGRISTLRRQFPWIPIGFSDHTVGTQAAIIAASLGACIFEGHFTLDRDLPGPDHSWCMLPHQLHAWVQAIRDTTIMLGTGKVEISELEQEQRRKYRRQSGQQLRGEA